MEGKCYFSFYKMPAAQPESSGDSGRPHCGENRTISPLSRFMKSDPPESLISLQEALLFFGFEHHFPSSTVQVPVSEKLPILMKKYPLSLI